MNELLPTAYGEKESIEYDCKRFSHPRGKVVNRLETECFTAALRKARGGSRTLEVGCGTGRFLEIAAKAGHEVYGLDPSPYMVKLTRQRLSGMSVGDIQSGEGVSLPFKDNFFDFVYTIRTMHVTSSRRYGMRMVREMLRVCRPQGLLLVEFANAKRIHFGRFRGVRHSIDDFREALAGGPSARIVDFRGIMLFSQTVLERVPLFLLGPFDRLDRMLSRLLPQFCARCYVTLRKG